MSDSRIPAVGEKIEKKYKGNVLTVTVTDAGLEYEGTTYTSISTLASVITGQPAINGYGFFKLGKSAVRKPRKAKVTADDAPETTTGATEVGTTPETTETTTQTPSEADLGQGRRSGVPDRRVSDRRGHDAHATEATATPNEA